MTTHQQENFLNALSQIYDLLWRANRKDTTLSGLYGSLDHIRKHINEQELERMLAGQED